MPGGKSSVNLGWDDNVIDEAPQLPRGKKRFDDRNCKKF